MRKLHACRGERSPRARGLNGGSGRRRRAAAPPDRVGRRQGDEETRAAIEIVALGFGEADRAAVARDEVGGDGEAEARPALAGGQMERLENVRRLFGGETGPGVADLDQRDVVGANRREADRGRPTVLRAAGAPGPGRRCGRGSRSPAGCGRGRRAARTSAGCRSRKRPPRRVRPRRSRPPDAPARAGRSAAATAPARVRRRK